MMTPSEIQTWNRQEDTQLKNYVDLKLKVSSGKDKSRKALGKTRVVMEVTLWKVRFVKIVKLIVTTLVKVYFFIFLYFFWFDIGSPM